MYRKRFEIGFWISALTLVGLLIAGCSSTSGPDINIENAWGRPSPKVSTAGVFYMLIKNVGNEEDKLISGKSPACGVVELHESYMTEDGAMGMRPVEGGLIEVPAGGEAELKMGGFHIMCIEKLEDFTVGSNFPLTLNFEKSGEMTIDIKIREP